MIYEKDIFLNFILFNLTIVHKKSVPIKILFIIRGKNNVDAIPINKIKNKFDFKYVLKKLVFTIINITDAIYLFY